MKISPWFLGALICRIALILPGCFALASGVDGVFSESLFSPPLRTHFFSPIANIVYAIACFIPSKWVLAKNSHFITYTWAMFVVGSFLVYNNLSTLKYISPSASPNVVAEYQRNAAIA